MVENLSRFLEKYSTVLFFCTKTEKLLTVFYAGCVLVYSHRQQTAAKDLQAGRKIFQPRNKNRNRNKEQEEIHK